jgi:acetyl coenzyme A synthetase (ADP forming)-like protein
MSNSNYFFNPSNVAIIGASREPGKIGHIILRNFQEGLYDGNVFPVNPDADEILGYECYSSVKEIPETVEHAVVSVPPGIANAVVKQCVDEHIPAVTIVTAGYEEIGDEGQQRQEELEQIIEGSDTRILGPNCLGIWDAYSGMDTLFLPDHKLERPPKGSIALISQSGSVGSSVMDMAADMGIGISKFVSYGNQADVSETELIEWLANDEETEAIAAYIEGAKDGEEFFSRVKDVTDKPVVILKAGKSTSGSAAASSHTGSLAGSYRVYRGAFRQMGVVEAETVDQLFDLSRALAYEKPPEGMNVAVITNGGGYGVIAADSVEREDMELTSFTDETKEKLEDVLPSYGKPNNPLDVIGDADPERYEQALKIAAKDPKVDCVLSICLLQPGPMDADILEVLTSFNDSFDKPMVACMVGGEYTDIHLKSLEHHRVPTFPTPERAIRALKGLYEYGQWKNRT